jgi:hypothetical protein
MNSKQAIKVVIALLLIVNLLSVYFFDVLTFRTVRAISVLFILIYFLLFTIKDYLILSFVCLLLFADILDLYFDSPLIPEYYFVVKISAYLLLLQRVLKKTNFLNVKIRDVLIVSAIAILNILIGIRSLYQVSLKTASNLELTLLFIYGFVLVLVGTFVANYYFRYASKRAFYFTTFVYLIMFADVSGYVANYFDIYFFNYLERFYYFLGFFYMAFYLIYTNELDDQENKLFE